MERNNLLVIIVAYNSMPWVERCYDSLRNSTYPCDILTIDNGSTDGTQNYIRTHYPEVELFESEVNLGFGKANNIGLQKAIDRNYQYVYLLNQDAWVKPDTFEKLIDFCSIHKEYGILSPMQLDGTAKAIDKNLLNNILCAEDFRQSFINDYYFSNINEVYDTKDVPAAHWLITRQCLLSVGGFSPTFPHYGEDNNYAQRVLYHGYKIGILPHVQAIHDRGDREPNLTKERQLYDTYIKLLIKTSNPYTPIFNNARKYGFIFLLRGIKRLDSTYIKYSIRLLKENKSINDNIKKSIKGFAFLKA